MEKDNSFYQLVEEVNRALLDNKKDGTSQEEQVTELMELEVKFKNSIWKYRNQCREIYKKFILMVVVENKNILSARPFFRERSEVFSAEITPIIRGGDVFKLKKFRVNYPFIKYVRDSWLGPFPAESQILFDQVTEARRKLVENNMPLAINKAKIFYRKVSQSHLTLNDLIGIAALGLINGIDKWVGGYDPKIRGMWIGRMTGNLIEDCSQTMIHFYPSDKHVLYRANSLRHQYQVDDSKILAKILASTFDDDRAQGRKPARDGVESDEIDSLLNASQLLSTDQPADPSRPGSETLLNLVDISQRHTDSIEETYANKEALVAVVSKIRGLPIVHRKVIKMKGIKT